MYTNICLDMNVSIHRQGKGLMVLAGATTNSETLLHLKVLFQCYITPLLNELRGGDRHTLSIHEIMKNFPQEYINRENDKLNYRYPGIYHGLYIYTYVCMFMYVYMYAYMYVFNILRQALLLM
jgi:broad specificity phosphatase PhoE